MWILKKYKLSIPVTCLIAYHIPVFGFVVITNQQSLKVISEIIARRTAAGLPPYNFTLVGEFRRTLSK